MKRVHIIVSGRVQGVAFRAMTQREAMRLNLTGWVRNLSDGRVEAVFEGDEGSVEQMVQWCKHGPRLAVVERIDTTEEPCTGRFRDFQIRYG